jgi:hypothetical protein
MARVVSTKAIVWQQRLRQSSHHSPTKVQTLMLSWALTPCLRIFKLTCSWREPNLHLPIKHMKANSIIIKAILIESYVEILFSSEIDYDPPHVIDQLLQNQNKFMLIYVCLNVNSLSLSLSLLFSQTTWTINRI